MRFVIHLTTVDIQCRIFYPRTRDPPHKTGSSSVDGCAGHVKSTNHNDYASAIRPPLWTTQAAITIAHPGPEYGDRHDTFLASRRFSNVAVTSTAILFRQLPRHGPLVLKSVREANSAGGVHRRGGLGEWKSHIWWAV
jgi:hypothetical protein